MVCTTIMNWFRRTCKESKTTSYYWLFTMIIMQSTGLQNKHNFDPLYFTLLFFEPAWFTGYENPPNKSAEITRLKNPPVKSTVKSCQIYSRLKPSEFTPWKNQPLQLAALLAREPPFPTQNPQPRPTIPSPPPPPGNSANGDGDRGQGAGPAHPRILNRYFYFYNGYIFLYDTTYTNSAQSGLIWKYNYFTAEERIIC